MQRLLIGAIVTSLVSIPGCARPDERTEGRVPFVGCLSDGQLGTQPAPKPRNTPVLASSVARQLAFYAASDGPGVLAPRGWHCFGVYGSNGSGLLVTPEELDPGKFIMQPEFRTKGYAVELRYD